MSWLQFWSVSNRKRRIIIIPHTSETKAQSPPHSFTEKTCFEISNSLKVSFFIFQKSFSKISVRTVGLILKTNSRVFLHFELSTKIKLLIHPHFLFPGIPVKNLKVMLRKRDLRWNYKIFSLYSKLNFIPVSMKPGCILCQVESWGQMMTGKSSIWKRLGFKFWQLLFTCQNTFTSV